MLRLDWNMNIRQSFCDLRNCEQPKSKMFDQSLQQSGVRDIWKVFVVNLLFLHTEEYIDHAILIAKDALK